MSGSNLVWYGWDGNDYEIYQATLQVNPILPGDYNGNGVLDAADYTAWRDALTAGATSLANDPTPGVVDESDFLYWRDHFGETLGSGSGSVETSPSQAVP